jgi:hypothetical protein
MHVPWVTLGSRIGSVPEGGDCDGCSYWHGVMGCRRWGMELSMFVFGCLDFLHGYGCQFVPDNVFIAVW